MAGILSIRSAIFVAVLGSFLAYIYSDVIYRPFVVLGAFRKPQNTIIVNADDFKVIDGTRHCEDLHYHEPSQQLFTACEGASSPRFSWFPPLANLDDPVLASKSHGEIRVIDPKAMRSRNLKLNNFASPFITHGIDILDDPEKPYGTAVYIFAVNHVPNPKHHGPNGSQKEPKSHSVIEVFYHVIGSNSADHMRTVWDPLIETPNDIRALSPTSFLVTNDHYYTEGPLRLLEDIKFSATWSSTIYVEFPLDLAASEAHGVKATVALTGLHNNNGLGRGRQESEVAIVTANAGTLFLGELSDLSEVGPKRIEIRERIQLDTSLDNPSYFVDPFADSQKDASGFVLTGLVRGCDLMGTIRDPNATNSIAAWKVSRVADPSEHSTGYKWEKKLLFEDDGSRIRSSSSAVLVAIDPQKENGSRRAWLFITGFMSKNMIAVKVDL